jgi:hypothetical protein
MLSATPVQRAGLGVRARRAARGSRACPPTAAPPRPLHRSTLAAAAGRGADAPVASTSDRETVDQPRAARGAGHDGAAALTALATSVLAAAGPAWADAADTATDFSKGGFAKESYYVTLGLFLLSLPGEGRRDLGGETAVFFVFRPRKFTFSARRRGRPRRRPRALSPPPTTPLNLFSPHKTQKKQTGLWSQIKRAPKSKRVRKVYEVPGPAVPGAMPLDDRARQIFQYFKVSEEKQLRFFCGFFLFIQPRETNTRTHHSPLTTLQTKQTPVEQL